MKRHGLRVLVALNVALLVALLLMWVRPDGSLRGVLWKPPAPRLANYAAQLPVLPSPAPSDTATFVAMLERPLFAGTRRPPPPMPPPPIAAEQAPPDNFSSAKLTGIFQSGEGGGVIIRIADKDKRVQLHQAIEGWTLKSVTGRDVTFTKGGENRVLQLQRASMVRPPPGTPLGAPSRLPSAQSPLSAFLPPSSAQSASVPAQVTLPGAAEPASESLAPTADGSAASSSNLPAAAIGTPSAPKAPRAVFGGTRSR